MVTQAFMRSSNPQLPIPMSGLWDPVPAFRLEAGVHPTRIEVQVTRVFGKATLWLPILITKEADNNGLDTVLIGGSVPIFLMVGLLLPLSSIQRATTSVVHAVTIYTHWAEFFCTRAPLHRSDFLGLSIAFLDFWELLAFWMLDISPIFLFTSSSVATFARTVCQA